MAEALVTHFRPGVGRPHPIERLDLVPSGGGVFDVEADGELVFSKHASGRHADHDEVIHSVEARLGK